MIGGAPCGDAQVKELADLGYKPSDVEECLIIGHYGQKLFKMKDGSRVNV